MLTKGPHGLGKVVPSASRDRERSRRRARSTQAPADAAPDVTSEVGFWTANYAERLRSFAVKCIGIRKGLPRFRDSTKKSPNLPNIGDADRLAIRLPWLGITFEQLRGGANYEELLENRSAFCGSCFIVWLWISVFWADRYERSGSGGIPAGGSR